MRLQYLYRGHGVVYGIRRTMPERPRFAWQFKNAHLAYVAVFGWVVLLSKYAGPCWWQWLLRPDVWGYIPLRVWCHGKGSNS